MIITDTFNLFWQIKHQCAGKSYAPELMAALFLGVMDPKQDESLMKIHQTLRRYYDHDLSEDEWSNLVKDTGGLASEMTEPSNMVNVISAIVDILDRKARKGEQE